MNIKSNRNALVSLFLSLLILFQSCQVYKKAPITLDEAVATNKKVRIITTDNRQIDVLKIEKIDSTYYGHKIVKGTLIKYPLIENKIQTISELDSKKSRNSTVLVVLGSVVLVVFTLFAVAYKPIEFSDPSSN